MPANKYIYPFVFNYGDYSQYEDDRTITRVKEIPKKKNCDSDLLDNPCCSFNVTRCNADVEYYQPVCVSNNACYCLKFNGDLGEPYDVIPPPAPGEPPGAFYTQPHVNFGNSIGEIGINDFEFNVDYNFFGTQMPGDTGVLLAKNIDFDSEDTLFDNSWLFGIRKVGVGYGVYFNYTDLSVSNPHYGIMTIDSEDCSIVPGNNRIKFGRKNNVYYASVNNVNKNLTFTFTQGATAPPIDIDVGAPGDIVHFTMGSHTLANTTLALVGGICAVRMTIDNSIQLDWKAKSFVNNILTPAIGPPGYMMYFPEDKNARWFSNSHCFDDCDPCGVEACVETDLLYFQFQYPDNFNDWEGDRGGDITHGWSENEAGNWLASVKIHSTNGCCDAKFNDYVYSAFVGATTDGVNLDGRTFQQIIIDPTELPNEFYLEFSFNLGGCRIIRKYTEPYRKTQCNDTTLKLEGLYNKGNTDCANYYYGDFQYYLGDLPFTYRNLIRIPARIEQNAMEITREEVSNRNFKKTVRTSLKETYNLRSDMLPPYVITKLKTIFMSRTVLSDGKELTLEGALNKNNDNGSMWLLDTTLVISSDNACFQQDFTCDAKKK